MTVRPRHLAALALLALAALAGGCSGTAPPAAIAPAGGGALSAAGNCPHPWVFSDLGAGTLVDTSHYDFDHETGPISPAPGAQDYLAALSKAGYTIGLIVNVPEEWGRTADAKIFKVIDMIDRAWDGAEPPSWNMFGKIVGTGDKRHFAGRFLVPDTDAHRKPHPHLFRQALQLAGGCGTLYMSTIKDEIPAADAAGMAGFQVVNHRYLPVAEIDRYVADHTIRD